MLHAATHGSTSCSYHIISLFKKKKKEEKKTNKNTHYTPRYRKYEA